MALLSMYGIEKTPIGILSLMVVMALRAFKIKRIAYLGYDLEYWVLCDIEVLSWGIILMGGGSLI